MIAYDLLFADYSYLFFRENLEECTQIKAGLNIYEVASGQKVNKSSIMFSPNTYDETKEEFYAFLKVP